MIPKILIVDRKADIGNQISLVLQQQGYETIVCFTAQEACSKAANYRPDLIVLDLPLDINGLELCTQIRSTLEMAHLPILMFTDAHHPSLDHYTDLDMGVTDDYLVKPFHPAELVIRVKALLNQ